MRRRRAQPDPTLVANAVRNHWMSTVTATCMRNAALLNLVEYGESDLRKLPAPLFELMARLCVRLRDEAAGEELSVGCRTYRLEQRINEELWRAMKPYRADAPPARQQALL